MKKGAMTIIIRRKDLNITIGHENGAREHSSSKRNTKTLKLEGIYF